MKSNASESICTARAVKYKRGKILQHSQQESEREGKVFNSDFSPQHEPGKNQSSRLTNQYAAS